MKFSDVIPGCVFEQNGYDWVKVDEESAWCPTLDREVLGRVFGHGTGTRTVVEPDEEVRQPSLDPSLPAMDWFVLFRKSMKLVGPFYSQDAAEGYAGIWPAGHAFALQPSIGK